MTEDILRFEVLRAYYGFCAEVSLHEARKTKMSARRHAIWRRELYAYIGALEGGEAAAWDAAPLYLRKLRRCLDILGRL